MFIYDMKKRDIELKKKGAYLLDLLMEYQFHYMDSTNTRDDSIMNREEKKVDTLLSSTYIDLYGYFMYTCVYGYKQISKTNIFQKKRSLSK